MIDLNATSHAQMPTGPVQWLDRPRSIAGEGVYGPQIQGLAAARSGYEEIGGIAWRRYKETKLTQIFRLQIVSSNPPHRLLHGQDVHEQHRLHCINKHSIESEDLGSLDG